MSVPRPETDRQFEGSAVVGIVQGYERDIPSTQTRTTSLQGGFRHGDFSVRERPNDRTTMCPRKRGKSRDPSCSFHGRHAEPHRRVYHSLAA